MMNLMKFHNITLTIEWFRDVQSEIMLGGLVCSSLFGLLAGSITSDLLA
jgi:hypothetical protein